MSIRQLIGKLLASAALLTGGATAAFGLDLDLPKKSINGREYYYYEVQPKESIYSLGHKLGIERSEIVRYNPAVIDGLRAHQILLFPVDETESQATEEPVSDENASADTSSDLPVTATDAFTDNDTTSVTIDTDDGIHIAVMLPFMLEDPKPSKSAMHYTDFYKGLLMAVDTMSSGPAQRGGIHIHAYDTGAGEDRTREILQSSDISRMDFIFAPADSLQLSMIATAADTTDAKVINLFAVRDELYRTHPSVINGNIPHGQMYRKAIDAFVHALDPDVIPVILNPSDVDNPGDKASFTELLQQRLDDEGLPYRHIDYSSSLDAADLSFMKPGEAYVFVPTSGSRSALNSFINCLLEKQESKTSGPIFLFGYPEWIILRGSIKEKLHQLNTTIYSRFVSDPDNYRTRNFENRFRQWYGAPMHVTAPMFGTLGFDAGIWAIRAADRNIGDKYTGIQNTFVIKPGDSYAGAANDALYLIRFTPTGVIDTVLL